MSPNCPACRASSIEALGPVDVRRAHREYSGGDEQRSRALDQTLGQSLDAYHMCRCSACKLEFAEPAAAPTSAWYDALYAALNLYPSARWEYGVVAHHLRPRDALIDYGCGSGHFLQSQQGRVARMTGFDASHGAIDGARAVGLDARLLTPSVDVGADWSHAADHLTAFHVLEHLAQPGSLFDFAGLAGRREASLWVAVPSDRRATRLYSEPDALDAPPHHLTRWTRTALERLGQQHGWRLLHHWYEPLDARLRVWEATRRLSLYARISPRSKGLRWAWRRALAAGVWCAGGLRMRRASGFSMLACFVRQDAA
jgi:Methyltransferase domain